MSYLVKSPYINEWSKFLKFAHSDTEQLYLKNKNELGPEWYWKDKEITYNFNRYGYRMKELEDVDFDNYYAFFGCSFTVGIGLPLTETYAYKIAQKAKVDYVNAGVGGSNVDFVLTNIVEMFTHAPKLPKKIIINWPELSRTFYWTNDSIEFYLANKDSSSMYWHDAYRLFLTEPTHIDNRFKTIRQTIQILCSTANVELFEFSAFQSDEHFRLTHKGIHDIPLSPEKKSIDIQYINEVFARDIIDNKPIPLAHPGIYFQDQVVSTFFEETK